MIINSDECLSLNDMGDILFNTAEDIIETARDVKDGYFYKHQHCKELFEELRFSLNKMSEFANAYESRVIEIEERNKAEIAERKRLREEKKREKEKLKALKEQEENHES